MNGQDRVWRRGALALAFAVPLGLYGATLAPTVTLEDSGELIAAAYSLGVPHSPGYPLFTMLGHGFSLLPAGDVAWRLNLMSACCSALAAMLLAWTVGLLGEALAPRTAAPLRWAAALAAGLWFATGYETWEQSIITEVYALNAAVLAALLLAIALARREPERLRWFVLGCGLTALALAAHPTSLIVLPLFGLHLWLDRGLPRGVRARLAGAAAFCAGLLPWLYLPLASAREPAIDWGDPDSARAFVHTVLVAPHRLRDLPAVHECFERVAAHARLLAEQWSPVVLPLALIGLAALWHGQRKLFWQIAAWLALTGPAVTLATNIDLSHVDARVAAENLAQVSVHYIPSYAVVSIVLGIGALWLAGRIARRPQSLAAMAAAIVALPLVIAAPNGRAVSMRDHHLAEDYATNLFAVAEPGSIVLADWDSFYFPLVYYQVVEQRRPDLTVLDQHLLRRSWYVEQWRERHPQTSGPASAEIAAFLEAVRPFEAGLLHDGREIQRRYEALLRALVAGNAAEGRSVYFVYDPPADLVRGRALESVLVARKLVTGRQAAPTDLRRATLRFRGLLEGQPAAGRWRGVFAEYYGRLAQERAALLERGGDAAAALELHERAARLLRR